MPIFEYRCQRCSHRFETIVLSSREKIRCPQCASMTVEKQLSVFSAPASGKQATSSTSTGCACTPQTCGCH
jgi:putative FmdB family regulatory protein